MNAAKKGIVLFLWLVVMTVATASAFVPSTSGNRVWEKIASGAELHPFTALQVAELQWDKKPFRLKLALDQTYPVNGLDPLGLCPIEEGMHDDTFDILGAILGPQIAKVALGAITEAASSFLSSAATTARAVAATGSIGYALSTPEGQYLVQTGEDAVNTAAMWGSGSPVPLGGGIANAFADAGQLALPGGVSVAAADGGAGWFTPNLYSSETGAIDLGGGITASASAADSGGGELGVTFRGDTRDATTIFNAGFTSQGSNMDLLAHAEGNPSPPSGFIATSESSQAAYSYADNIYVVRSVRGINVNETLGSDSPNPDDLEVAVPLRIAPEDIRAVTWPEYGISLLNPNWKP